MRVVGFFLRAVIITIALLGFTIVFVGGLMFFVLWFALPVLIVSFTLNGVTSLFS